jgi:Uncharacterized metal-binding protein
MPSGYTHDRITLWSLPFVAALTFGQTQSSNLTLLVSGSFLFGGLMFGPDLDIYSCQYQRWGWLRPIWLPYQKSLRHRSFLSHGPLIGTALRILYLTTWIGLVGDIWTPWQLLKQSEPRRELAGSSLSCWRSIAQYHIELFMVYIGLELGAMSHYLSDWGGSAYKRFKKKGLSGWRPPSPIKRRKRKAPIHTSSKSIVEVRRKKEEGLGNSLRVQRRKKQ